MKPSIFAAFVCGAAILGCGRPDAATKATGSSASEHRGMRVVTTCGMVTDIVRAVTGSRCEVIGLMGEGVDPHLYRPTRNDMREFSRADLVLYSGLHLEGRLTAIFEQMSEAGRPVRAVTEAIDPGLLRTPAGFEGRPDPHVWMDVSLWSQCVGEVARVLSEYDPAGAEEYASNALAYRSRLAELDAHARRVIGSIPREQRVLVTAHDAFGYFGRAYDIEVMAIQGVSTESDAGVEDVNRLVRAIVARRIPAIFVESSVPEKHVRAIVEGAAARDWSVRIGGELYSDAMGPAGTHEGTYIGMIEHNVATIASALGGASPPGGVEGKLNESP